MTKPAFAVEYQVQWRDLDPNNHLRNTGFLDYATQTRFRFLAENGFGPAEFAKAGIGPAIRREEIDYRRELRFLETFRVDHRVAGQNADGSRFVLVNRFFRGDGSEVAAIRAQAAWFDLKLRRVAPPPAALKAAMDAAVRTEDFRAME